MTDTKRDRKPAAIDTSRDRIERLYYQEGKDLAWRAAHMRGIAADVLTTLTADTPKEGKDDE